jgi:hypothetical protein
MIAEEKGSVYVAFHKEFHVSIYKDLVGMITGTGPNKQWVSELAKRILSSFAKVKKS